MNTRYFLPFVFVIKRKNNKLLLLRNKLLIGRLIILI